jgi:hypothetical protein
MILLWLKGELQIILTEDLVIRKLSVCRVLRLLTVDLSTPGALCRLVEVDPGNFLMRFVALDETWVRHFTPRNQPNQRENLATPPPERTNTVPPCTLKGYGSFLWNSDDLFVWSFVYCFTSRSTGEGLQIIGLCSALRAPEQGGIFIVPTPAVTQDLGFSGLIWRTAPI